MRSAARDIATILDGVSSLGLTKGTDLFHARMNDDPDNRVTVFDNPGGPPLIAQRKVDSGYHYSSVSVQVRNIKYNDGYAVAQAIVEYLHAQSGDVVAGTLYTLIRALNSPQLLHYDKNDRPIFVVNFEVQRRNN